MDALFDKDNLVSFIKSSQHPLFVACNRMLKNKFDVKLTFSKSAIEEETEDKQKDEDNKKIKQWLALMTDGRKPGWLKWNINIIPKTLSAYMHEKYEDKNLLSSIFLLSHKKTRMMQSYGGLIYACVGEEVETLSNFIFNKNDIINSDDDPDFHKQFEIEKMKSWEDVREYTTPCTDIILIDQYIFSSEELYNYNIYPLLKELSRHSKDFKLNIVIFTTPDTYDRRTNHRFTPKWNDIEKNIKIQFKVEPNVTFVLSSDLEVHDRLLFTNYRGIHSGDTYNYFDSKWRIISDGVFLDFYSLAKKNYYKNWMNLIEKLQGIIDEIKMKNRDHLKGDRKSNYLRF